MAIKTMNEKKSIFFLIMKQSDLDIFPLVANVFSLSTAPDSIPNFTKKDVLQYLLFLMEKNGSVKQSANIIADKLCGWSFTSKAHRNLVS